MSQKKRTFLQHRLLAWLVVGGLLVGALCGRPPAGQSARPPAGNRENVDAIPPGHFLAGGERSVPILQEISATLKRMDERLARLEKIALATVEADSQE